MGNEPQSDLDRRASVIVEVLVASEVHTDTPTDETLARLRDAVAAFRRDRGVMP